MSTKSTEQQTLATAAPAEAGPRQGEIPLAKVRGEPVLQLPQDLYIPPDALEVILESFEGPLDLLLYLIRKQNLDILDIPIAEITRQYMGYIETMHAWMRLELASEYLLMAAILAEIKSRLLLPRPVLEQGEEEDPRAELVRRLQEYERYKLAAEALDARPRLERDTAVAQVAEPVGRVLQEPPPLSLDALLAALQQVLARAELFSHHAIRRETLSVRQRMTQWLQWLADGHWQRFERRVDTTEGRLGVVVSLLAILELAKENLVEIVQDGPQDAIQIRIHPGRNRDQATGMAAIQADS